MVALVDVKQTSSLFNQNWHLDFIRPFLPWCEIADDVKGLIWLELFLTWLEMDLIEIFLWNPNFILNFVFGGIFDPVLFACVDAD
jgi:hypothetical protein